MLLVGNMIVSAEMSGAWGLHSRVVGQKVGDGFDGDMVLGLHIDLS